MNLSRLYIHLHLNAIYAVNVKFLFKSQNDDRYTIYERFA